MYYEMVEWHHSFAEEPVVIIYELDGSRWETRKMELFADGTIGMAGTSSDHGYDCAETTPPSGAAGNSSTLLAEMRTPPLAEICSNPEFSGTEISHAHFEAMWRLAQSAQRPRTV